VTDHTSLNPADFDRSARLGYGHVRTLVLSAGGPVGWFEIWADALAGAPEPHVTVEFEPGEEPDDAG
jgi:hypothetical protein